MQLRDLLNSYRGAAKSEHKKGVYFERVVRVFLENDDAQKQYYSAVVPFADWAKERGWTKVDTGIDLVATLADGSGYAAIQCKFYAPNHTIGKPDIDSFISAASNDLFTRLIIVDTTQKDFGKNAEDTLDKLSKEWLRIGLSELEASRIDWSQFLRTGTVSLAPEKELRDHQRDALRDVTLEGVTPLRKGQGRRTRLLFLFFGTGHFRYGVAEVFRHVLNGLDQDLFEPYLVVTGTLTEPVSGLAEGVEVVQLHREGLRRAFFPLVRVLRELQPDVVISAMEHPNVLAVLARIVSMHRCKLVLTTHGMITPRLKYMWNRTQGFIILNAVRWTYRFADEVVCVSKAVREDLVSQVAKLPSTSVIYNPVLCSLALPSIAKSTKQKGMIVTSSRLVTFKKVDEVIRALPFLDDHFYLIVLGDGPERGRLESLVIELGLDERVEFAGYVDNPFEWYRKAEIFILPSMWEGFGNVLRESMACGCQVIANADAWAPREILGDGKFGFLYKGGDPEALSIAIKEASTNPIPVEQLVAYAQQFTDKRAAGLFMERFDALLAAYQKIEQTR